MNPTRRADCGPARGATNSPGLVVGIDASRNRSGGAKTHLIGILGAADPREFGIARVHLWSYRSLLQAVPDRPWLIKHNPEALQRSLLQQVFWQRLRFPRELGANGCKVLLTTDAGSVCRFSPSVVMSRDMLSFEANEMQRYRVWSFARLRLVLLRHMQVSALRQAAGALFLTKYAADVIQRYSGPLPTVRIIPHGIADQFRVTSSFGKWPGGERDIRCVYVSNADMYKHQWHVVGAIAELRRRGHPVNLTLVGGGSGPAKDLISTAVRLADPDREFIKVTDSIAHGDVPGQLAESDIFIFASSCENMPNTLVEGMAAGLPIACSRRGPMPEILEDAGTYFDPEEPATIAAAIEKLIIDHDFRHAVAVRAKMLSERYSWVRCAQETWSYVADIGASLKPKQVSTSASEYPMFPPS